MVLTLYRMHFFCFQMCDRLPEMMKNGDAGIFHVYYSLNQVTQLLTDGVHCGESAGTGPVNLKVL